jgi:hypothetical protein
LPTLHRSLLLSPGVFPESKEIPTPPPQGFLIGTYIFCENGSTETFGKNGSKR